MKWQGIVIHHSKSHDVSAHDIRQWHLERDFRDIGYHFVITQNGGIQPGRPLDQVGAHAAGRNATHIGICWTGRGNEQPPTLNQFWGLVYLLRGLREYYKIPLTKIEPHHAECPGTKFDWLEFKSKLVGMEMENV